VSGTVVTPATGGVLESGTATGRRLRLSATGAVILGAVVVALALRLFQLTRPGYLLGVTEYDDGPYFGSAIRLLSGSLPYRDFVLVQPPGITLLMVPAALLGKITGSTAAGMAAGRVLTALASTAGVALAGLLVRHRGVLATLLACGILAVYPNSVAAAHTVLVEPWLVLFCLLGAVAIFDRDQLTASRGRLLWGGAAFGFAGAVELWAIMPVLAVSGLCLAAAAPAAGLMPRIRRAALFAAGTAAGFFVPVVPFAAAGLKGFYQSLIVAQVGTRAHPVRVPQWVRFRTMLSLPGLHLPVLGEVAAVVGFVAVALAVTWLLTRALPAPLEWFALVSTVLVTLMFMWPDQFHYHFVAFLGPFLGLSIGLVAGRLADAVLATRPLRGEAWLRWFVPGVAGLLLAGCTVLVARGETGKASYVQMTPGATAAVQRMQQLVPPGSCVVTDQESYLIIADRATSTVPGCSQMIDTLGTDLGLSGGLRPATGAGGVPAVAAVWHAAFAHAQYAWLTYQSSARVPWNHELRAYFRAHFVQILRDDRGDALYRRTGG
jgi:alpha-1,2-mannosyltransferase